jgi:integrase
MDDIRLKNLDLSVLENLRSARNSFSTLADKSQDAYYIAGKQFNEFLDKNNMVVCEDSIVKFFYENSRWSAVTKNLKRQALMKLIQNQSCIDSYLKMALVREMFTKNIPRVKKIRQAITNSGYLTENQIKRLIQNSTKRIGLVIEFLFCSGCRVSELINIKRRDVHNTGDVFTVYVVGKGSKQRIVFADSALIEEIDSVFSGVSYLFETINNDQFDRSYIWNSVSSVGKKLDLKVYPHIFRHSCAMHLKKAGKTPDFIQKYLGHENVAITLAYYFHHEPKAETAKLFKMR